MNIVPFINVKTVFRILAYFMAAEQNDLITTQNELTVSYYTMRKADY
jgi:hypothetical protein